ncbi:MAG: hypothetical protein U9O94_09880 [Nanoarchaeota archaeon]|nr:hypothetical protein [Nanoarchaeota archaeon]
MKGRFKADLMERREFIDSYLTNSNGRWYRAQVQYRDNPSSEFNESIMRKHERIPRMQEEGKMIELEKLTPQEKNTIYTLLKSNLQIMIDEANEGLQYISGDYTSLHQLFNAAYEAGKNKRQEARGTGNDVASRVEALFEGFNASEFLESGKQDPSTSERPKGLQVEGASELLGPGKQYPISSKESKRPQVEIDLSEFLGPKGEKSED